MVRGSGLQSRGSSGGEASISLNPIIVAAKDSHAAAHPNLLAREWLPPVREERGEGDGQQDGRSAAHHPRRHRHGPGLGRSTRPGPSGRAEPATGVIRTFRENIMKTRQLTFKVVGALQQRGMLDQVRLRFHCRMFWFSQNFFVQTMDI